MPEDITSEDATPDEVTVTTTLLRGPDGSIYGFSDATLEAHRLPDDVAEAVLAAFPPGGDVVGYADPGSTGLPIIEPMISPDGRPMSFELLGRAPAVRRRGLTVPTYQTWFDV